LLILKYVNSKKIKSYLNLGNSTNYLNISFKIIKFFLRDSVEFPKTIAILSVSRFITINFFSSETGISLELLIDIFGALKLQCNTIGNLILIQPFFVWTCFKFATMRPCSIVF